MKKLKIYAGIAATCYVIYCIYSVFDCSYAPALRSCVAVVALLAWAYWTIYTIDEKRKYRESRDLRFEYSRVMDDFPDDFDAFCKKHHIGATEAFVRDAVKKEMCHIEKERAEQE